MKNRFRRVLSLLLAVVMTATLIQVPVNAAEYDEDYTIATESEAIYEADNSVPDAGDGGEPDIEVPVRNVGGNMPVEMDIQPSKHYFYLDDGMGLEEEERLTRMDLSFNHKDGALLNNYVSSVKNQGYFGTCWAHSAMAVAESGYIKLTGDEANLSEAHLVNFQYDARGILGGPDGGLEGDKVILNPAVSNNPLQSGGNRNLSMFALASWKGAADEATDPSLVYPNVNSDEEAKTYKLNISDDLAYSDALHLKNSYIVLLRDSDGNPIPTGFQAAKELIRNFGGLEMAYKHTVYCDGGNSATKDGKDIYEGIPAEERAVYFFPSELLDLSKFESDDYEYVDGDSLGQSGHAVTIVGWDDNYPKENFLNTLGNKAGKYVIYDKNGNKTDRAIPVSAISGNNIPKNDGAWLVKNSWGNDYGHNGYFWLSYEDMTMDSDVLAIEWDNDFYDHNYQYDGSSSLYTYGYNQTKSEFASANIFTVNGAPTSCQEIKGVSYAVASPDATCEIEIYTSDDFEGDPTNGEKIWKGTKKTQLEGVYTVEVADGDILKPLMVEGGKQVSVVVTVKSESGPHVTYVDRSGNYGWVSVESCVLPGQSYICWDGDWYDCAKDKDLLFNNRIKLFTNDVTEYNDIEVVVNENSYEYTGDVIAPDWTAYYFGKELDKEGFDRLGLSVSYNGIEPGTHTLSVLHGSDTVATTDYAITKRELKADMLKAADAVLTWDGKVGSEYTGKIVLTADDVAEGKSPINGTDYTVSFGKSDATVLNASRIKATFNAKEDSAHYSGMFTAYVQIAPSPVTSDKATFDLYVENGDGNYVKATLPGADDTGVIDMTSSVIHKFPAGSVKPKIKLVEKDSDPAGDKVVATSNYSVSYSANNNPEADGVITFGGKKNISGKLEIHFDIANGDISKATAALKTKNLTYTGKSQVPTPTVKYGKTTLKASTDYNFQIYKDGNNISALDSVNAGNYSISVNGVGKYAGSSLYGESLNYVINPKKLSSSNIAVEVCKDTVGNKVDVYYGKVLLNSSDYTNLELKDGSGNVVPLSSVVDGEKYEVSLSLAGNYSGDIVKKNIVCKTNIGVYSVKLEGVDSYSISYNGAARKPAVTVYSGDEVVDPKNYTVAYANNKDAGTASVTIRGKASAGFVGYLSKTFEIVPLNVTAEDILISNVKASYKYTGSEIQVKPTVKVGRTTLKLNRDYELSWSNSTNVNDGGALTPTVTVDLKGNYRGTDSAQYNIVPAKITTIKVSGKYYSIGDKNVKPTIKVYAEGRKTELVEGTDYTLGTLSLNGTGNKEVTLEGIGNYVNYPVSKVNNVKKFKVKVEKEPLKTLTITDFSSVVYSGTAYTIVEKASENLPESNYLYDGINSEPITADMITTTKSETDKILVTYKNNVKAGKATITWTAGKYCTRFTGSISKTFIINRCDLTSADIMDHIDDSKSLGGFAYTGKNITFKKDVLKKMISENGIKTSNPEYEAYDLNKIIDICGYTYKNNKRPGVAYVVINGKGNYSGKIEIPFIIGRIDLSDAVIYSSDGSEITYSTENKGEKNVSYVKLGKTKLIENRDYVVRYVGNDVKPGETKTAYIHIIGIGEYCGNIYSPYTVRR